MLERDYNSGEDNRTSLTDLKNCEVVWLQEGFESSPLGVYYTLLILGGVLSIIKELSNNGRF